MHASCRGRRADLGHARNLGYIYRREAMLRGESVFLDIKHQFHTELPFEGHHREYIRDEVTWMLNETRWAYPWSKPSSSIIQYTRKLNSTVRMRGDIGK